VHLRLIVNGQPHELDVPPDRSLADILRKDLHLTGTKIGCGEGICGSCTVIVNGRAVRSCRYPARRAQGATVETIEGLSQDGGDLHPLQKAFIQHGAIQCGFCTPGMIMSAKALLDRTKAQGRLPTEDEIRSALKGNLCRCTGYHSIIRAVRSAAGENISPAVPETLPPERVVGRSLPRPDAVAKATGRAVYTDDLRFPGMLHAAVKRSERPHARILAIDTSRAASLPGVHAVLTHDDIPGETLHGLVVRDWPVLCADKVRYVGDAVAIVAADTPETARRAVELIAVEYQDIPAGCDPLAALKPDAPLVHEKNSSGNLIKHIRVRKGDVAAGFAEADEIAEITCRTPTVEHLFLEPECSIAVPAGYDPSAFGGSLDESAVRGPAARHAHTTIYVGSQIPYADRNQVAAALAKSPEDVRIVATLMGGGFGGKEDIAGQIHAALLAEKTGRPVKLLFSRRESMLVHPKRHATVIRVRAGARRSDGRITAVEAEIYGDGGAYASLSEHVMTRTTTHVSGPYDIPNVKADCYAVYTNNPPSGAFRGFGVTQSCFAVESAMDILAERLGLDPIEFRLRNALDVGSVTCTGQKLTESVGLRDCIRTVAERIQAYHAAAGSPFNWSWTRDGVRYGWGFAAAYKNTGLGGGAPDQAEAEVELSLVHGRPHAEVRISSAELGQGLPTVLAQIAAEELQLDYRRVSVLLGDTDFCPDGGPTTASRQSFVSGNATRFAARALLDHIRETLADLWNVPAAGIQYRQRTFHAQDHNAPLAEAVRLVQQQDNGTCRARFLYHAPQTKPLGAGGDMHFAFGFAAMAALCAVHPDGRLQVLRIIAAHDPGRALNPLALEGQIEGGILMGLGQALMEDFVLHDGVPQRLDLKHYRIPRSNDAPPIESHIIEHPCSTGPFGAKGVGELPSIPVAPAVINAVYHATGVRFTRLPLDPAALRPSAAG